MLKKPLKIALTGGTGFLGSHLLAALKNQEIEATCLVRSQSQAPVGISVVRGDCLDEEAMTKLIRGQDVFVHMAALLFGSSWQDYFRANLRAARLIVKILARLPRDERPSRMIFISSLAAAGPCAVLPGKSEAEEPEPVSAYGWSKLCCEQSLAAAPVSRLVILRPPIIYGSGDKGLLPIFRSAARGIGVSPGAFRKFPVSVIHAADASAAILLACQAEIDGIFHLSDGSPLDMDTFCKKAAQACGRGFCHVFHPPLPVMAVTAAAAGLFYTGAAKFRAWTGARPPQPPHWNLDKYRESSQAGWLANAAKFASATGFTPQVNLEAGLSETVAAYRERGWL